MHPIRFVTAASLFDGHDASISLFRRLLQASGVEVIHLGHNRSVQEIVETAIQEDVQGIAVSSYQGGHMEFFRYLLHELQQRKASHIQVFAGGGGVIVAEERKKLEQWGLNRVFSPHDGQQFGLQGIVDHMITASNFATIEEVTDEWDRLKKGDFQALARLITYCENEKLHIPSVLKRKPTPVFGITGTGGAGKSSLTDELLRRFLTDYPTWRIAIISIDPTKRKTGGALLGDRIRMNTIYHPRVFMRSMATRQTKTELSDALEVVIQLCQVAAFDLIIVETSGIGQGDAEIATVADASLYVMTSEYGAASQLEKIEMLDFADFVTINKFDRQGSVDALHDVQKQIQRNQQRFSEPLAAMPVFGTIASRFHDPGVLQLYHAIRKHLQLTTERSKTETPIDHRSPLLRRKEYLREIAETIRHYHVETKKQSAAATEWYHLSSLKTLITGSSQSEEIETYQQRAKEKVKAENRTLIKEWADRKAEYQKDEVTYSVRDQQISMPLYTISLAGTSIPKIALPPYQNWGEQLQWLRSENLPGYFPYTAGIYPFKRTDEAPRRQFAGEGSPARTNRRFHYLSRYDQAKRLSVAFDSVTLYGENPDERLDIYGKIGESGVSICTWENMKQLFADFDLCDPSTSVSMTINGPAPILLAMFFRAAIDQQLEKYIQQHGREPTFEEEQKIENGVLQQIRGTVQADILKEDQGQNTCIFSTEFALRLMGDVQEYFIKQRVRNFYSVSISGYHIAEAGANPITQLAFTLANAFTYVEYYLNRGMKIDDFAPNLSFFFSNGLDPEYTVIGRVARRIWAIAMRDYYEGNERSQKLKYHIQTSGRSLHAQEASFNDIRTTLQALLAISDQCNSLHTNAYDEAITTPTEASVRQAIAIQMIIMQEFGWTKNENPYQGSYFIEQLTNQVEEAVLKEFERINERGGVLGAMEHGYQRSKIQDESLLYEQQKHSGELPIIGVNRFQSEEPEEPKLAQLTRATEAEKKEQIDHLQQFHQQHRDQVTHALKRLKVVARKGDNIFVELMETVKVASLGQITQALYEVGGQYRRNM
ncbi:fused isobutyryl-CoA mutase/GTPase IcmF [Seinonella peptonophila]|nr:fused isobutyryl-CoA mutase/GTPase IcmF [Seinonella peptonophila]